MKRLYFIMTLMFIAVLTSCSQEEVTTKTTDNNLISISAELPGDIAATRAQIQIPASHKLRCIIEVWTKTATPDLKYREEVLVAGGSIPTFDFELKPDDYTCLIWTDFVMADAVAEEITNDDVTYMHYADTYYDTSNLNAVTIKDEAGAALFNSDLCDGFYANLELKKTEGTVQKSLKLIRPFAKLIVKETDAEKFATLTGLTVKYEVPKAFNVATGEPGAEKLMAICDKIFESGDKSQVLFTGYAFTSSVGFSVGSAMFSFSTSAGKIACEIPEGSIKLTRNEQMVASGALIAGAGIAPEPEPEPEPSGDPKVGDYFFSDGTWSSELTDDNKANCVGIVYAVGAQAGDNISDYGVAAAGKSIKGYVVALKNVDTSSMGFTNGVHVTSGRPQFYKKDGKAVASDVSLFAATEVIDIQNHTGYKKTSEFLNSQNFKGNTDEKAYPALYALTTYKKNAVVSNASEWYIPSLAQLHLAAGSCYGFAEKDGFATISKNEELNAAFTAAADPFTTSGGGYYVYTSCLTTDSGISFFQINNTGTVINLKNNAPAASQGLIRPFLTIIK